jgi:ABC-2 type transport system ATP-binding protein
MRAALGQEGVMALPEYPSAALRAVRVGSTGTAVAVHGLRKSFGKKEAVAGIDLEIAAGSLTGLVGPNGAGKTTSLSMMTGLLRPDDGQVLIKGLDAWADPPAAKALIGVIPAEVRLFERLSGRELLEYAGRLRGLPATEARSRAAQLLDVLDLARSPPTSSAGC